MRALTEQPANPGRGLATARAVLRVLAYLAEHPEGVRADEVANVVGKSQSTAYYLLASLCEEGFAVHQPGGLYRLNVEVGTVIHSGEPAPQPLGLAGAVHELSRRTHKRAYVAVPHAGALTIAVEHGRQGMPKLPGLESQIRDSAHALALGKILLASLSDRALERYIAQGLRRFTPATITSSEALVANLRAVRLRGFALDREEFHKDFCCVAAPVLGKRGELLAVLGVSASARQFDAERAQLADVVREVARETTARIAEDEAQSATPSSSTAP